MNDPAPFLRSPRLELIGACRDTGSDQNCAKPSATAWKHTFLRAARFSVPRYGQHRQPIDSDGLLIYEGMTLSVDPETGVYDLNFTATSPPTPVTLRLQLQFVKKESGFTKADPVRLTLPPIFIDADPKTRPGDDTGTTLKVSHRGFTELFKTANDKGQGVSSDLKWEFGYDKLHRFQIDSDWKIVRAGSARFGSGSANADDASR